MYTCVCMLVNNIPDSLKFKDQINDNVYLWGDRKGASIYGKRAFFIVATI